MDSGDDSTEYEVPDDAMRAAFRHPGGGYHGDASNNSNSNDTLAQRDYLHIQDVYRVNTEDPEDGDTYEPLVSNRPETGRLPLGDKVIGAPRRENPFNRIVHDEDPTKGLLVTSLVKQIGETLPIQHPLKLPGAVGTPFLGKSRVPPIGAEQSPTESDEARQRPNPTWPDGGLGEPGETGSHGRIWEDNVAYEGFQEDQGYTISPSHLASRFDALECHREDGTFYEDMHHFDEGEHGFFIDDDLYDDILGMADDDYVMPDESESSWGSEEWDSFSEDSDTDDHVHSYVDPNEPSARGVVEHGSSTHSRSVVGGYGIDSDQSAGKEEPKVKMIRDRSTGLDKVRSFLFGRPIQGKTGDLDENEEDKDDIQYIDVKLNTMKHPPPILPPQPDWLTPEEIGRRHVIQAIVDSERSYMVSLQRLIQNYEKPLLESNPPVLEKEKVKAIFYRVRGIYQCHLMFQIALASRVKNWDEMQQIGDVFVASFSKAMVLDVYSSFVNNFTHAMETAKRAAAQKQRFQEFLEKHQSLSNDRLSLYALMLKPVQRFPQFICLLQDLLKRTPLNHPDRMPLQLALTKLETLAGVLNERKRQSEQKHAVKHLIRNINAKFSVKMGNDGQTQRWLVRQDDVLQTTYDNHGEELKCKERRLVLLNDLLVCTTPITNSNSPGLEGQRYKHRWSVPLSEVEVLEPSPEGGNGLVSKDLGRLNISTHHMDENEYLYGGSTRQLYQERNDLMHDLAVVKQLGAMLNNLKGTYGVLTQEDIEEWSQIIHKLIRKKGQEIKQADVSKIQLSLPSIHANERVTVVFDTVSPKIKQDWLTALETARLGLKPQNNPGWYAPDESDSTLVEMNFGVPLHMKTLSIRSNQEDVGKIQNAVLIPPERFCFPFRKRNLTGGDSSRTSLWLCTSDEKNTEVAIVGFQPVQVKETFLLDESQVLCMEYVPSFYGESAHPNGERRREYAFKGPTVWMGCKSGRICVYEVRQSDKSHYTASFQVLHPVLDVKYMDSNLYAALANGTVLVYSRSSDGQWGVNSPREIELDTMAVTCLLSVQSTMWCGCGNNVFILEPESDFRVTSFEAHQDPRQNVRQLVIAGIGVWVAFTASDTIRLFHVETLQVLQDISVASPVNRMIASLKQKQSLYVTQPIYVTTFLACHGSLWVGTNTGVIVNFPLPRLEGVPLVNGPAMVSYHAHYSPIRFLTSMEIHQQHDKVMYSSTEDDTKSEVSSVFSERVTTNGKSKSASDKVSSVMSPMTDYFSLTPHDTESKPLPGEVEPDEDPPSSADEAEEDDTDEEEEVFAKITSTTSLVISGGEGHSYLMNDSTIGQNKVANILMWQVSM